MFKKTSQHTNAVVSVGPTVTMEPLNISSTTTISRAAVSITAKPQTPPNTKKTQVYQQRKLMLMEYRELFTALMKLPDKEIQRKICNVINDETVECRSMATQTDPVEIREFKREENEKQVYIIKELNTDGESLDLNPKSQPEETMAIKKRKRKRKISLPHANKESRVTKQVAKANKPISLNSKSLNNNLNNSPKTNDNPLKRQCFDPLMLDSSTTDSSILNCVDDLFGITTHKNLVKDVFLSNIELENGLLPIHDAIVKNLDRNLSTQIYIWKEYNKFDLNELLTNDDQDLLQLAIVNSPSHTIINMLLEAGLNPNCLDGESNTVIHLAILHDIDVTSLDHLMQHIDLKLLVTLNDDGYNPLHLAIRHDRFLLAERLINVLDKRLVGNSFYERVIDVFETDENILKTQFKDYYEKVCLLMEVEDDSICIQNHDLKQKLLQTGDRRSGNTALYFAIDNTSDHLIYFLLAHLTDPRTENLCGVDCKTFFSEYGKSLNLTLNIDNAMEKVIKILS